MTLMGERMGIVRSRWRDFVTAGGYFGESHPEYRRAYLINVLLLFTVCVCAIFLSYHLAVTQLLGPIVLDATALVVSILVWLHFRRTRKVELTANLVNVIAFAGLAAYLLMRHDQNEAVIWAALYPPFAYFLSGKRKGGIFAGLFVLTVVSLYAVDVLFLTPAADVGSGAAGLLNVLVGMLALYGMLYYYEATRQEATARFLDAQERLVRLSYTDELTGLYNRRQFEQVLPLEVQRARRERLHLGLMVVDVDHFKNYNDRYGHPAGDRVLQEIAACLRGSAQRAGDFAFRIGGEEFAVVYSFAPAEEATELPERIRRSIRSLGIENAGTMESVVTVSIGLRTVDPMELDTGVEAEGLFVEADRALYQAKDEGRNRVRIHEREDAKPPGSDRPNRSEAS